MSDKACPLPATANHDEADMIRRMLAGRRIAVVGLSDDPSRASYGVAQYLRAAGKEIIPVNPTHETVMGFKCYPTLEEVPGPIDVVNVFRRPEFCADVAAQAVKVRAKGVWLQAGIYSDEAERIALEGGLDFVQGRCIMVDHMHRNR